jgi:tRNA (guanine37-N1)-methyltransferase
MIFDILTIFPGMISCYLNEGVLGRAAAGGRVRVRVVNIRDFATGVHRSTDDRPYGGGAGMVMRPGPIYRALESVERVPGKSCVVLLSPGGRPFDQAMAWEFSQWDQLLLICGRYEGIDERIRLLCVEREVSIGDYVLSGGELGALVIMEAVSRLIPGVLGDDGSAREDCFEDGILKYPQFTRPAVFMGQPVPPVLLSGNHEEIRRWRRLQALKRTLELRPDLLEEVSPNGEDREILEQLRREETQCRRSIP